MARPTDWWRPIRNWLRMVRRRSARVTVDLLAHSAGGGDVIAQFGRDQLGDGEQVAVALDEVLSGEAEYPGGGDDLAGAPGPASRTARSICSRGERLASIRVPSRAARHRTGNSRYGSVLVSASSTPIPLVTESGR